jgi:para-aminobenzoate synthetase component I
MPETGTFINNPTITGNEALYQLLDSYGAFAIYDSHQWPLDTYRKYEKIIAAGIESSCCIPFSPEMDFKKAWQKAAKFINSKPRWIFGVVSYDVKNAFENLHSFNHDAIGFPWLILFEPSAVLTINGNAITGHGQKTAIKKIKETLTSPQINPLQDFDLTEFKAQTGKQEYLDTVRQIKQHISAGDVYELNYCMEYVGKVEAAALWPMYTRLMQHNQTPMSGYFRFEDFNILSGSPERFLQKSGNQLVVQPIKGTRKRGLTDMEDRALMHELQSSAKDRAENVMIVDLTRNDLSRICKPGSVKVPELFGVYGFPQVLQMISTVSGQLEDGVSLSDIFKNTLPMGSMTGAPKIKAMELIERYERMRRGAYAGCMGYLDPQGNMDFNVLIRSLIVNTNTAKASFCTGGAIVYDSNPEEEYEECLLKASNLLRAWT